MLVEDRSLREKIKKAQEGDEKVVKVVEELKRAGMKSLRDEEQSIEKGVVIKEGYIYTVMTQPKTAKSLFIFIFIFFSFNQEISGYARWNDQEEMHGSL